jgi:hypothetical protein
MHESRHRPSRVKHSAIRKHEDPDMWTSSSGDDVEDVENGMSQDGLCRCLRCGGNDEQPSWLRPSRGTAQAYQHQPSVRVRTGD